MLQLRPRSDFGRLMCSSPSRWLVLARDEFSRDEFFTTSDKDQGVFEQLHLVNVLLVYTLRGPLALLQCALPLVVCRVSLVASQRW